MESRFFAQVEYSDDCWEWLGHKPNGTYGRYHKTKAHRWSYEYFIGTIPKDKIICHHCDNPACVNPFHLYAGTYKDNSQDMIERGRNHWLNKVYCKRGHLLLGANLLKRANGSRACRLCKQASDRKYWHKKHKDYRGEK